MTALIVLDINGVVCNKTTSGIRISPYYCIEPINGYMEFVEDLLETYAIAWFSSTTERNASKILKTLGLFDLESEFKWYRDMTDQEGTIKSLEKVKQHHPGFQKYIIVDDSCEKISCNHEDEFIVHTDYSVTMRKIRELVSK